MFLLPLLLGCVVDSSSECVASDPVAIDDDELLGDLDVSATDVMAAIGGARTAPGKLADDTPTEATITVARGEGPALFTAVELVTTSEMKPGMGHDWGPLAPTTCADYLRVPTVVTMATDDGSIEIGGEGEAEIARSEHAGPELNTTVTRTVDPAVETVPAFEGGAEPFVALTYVDEALTFVKVGWSEAAGSAVYSWDSGAP